MQLVTRHLTLINEMTFSAIHVVHVIVACTELLSRQCNTPMECTNRTERSPTGAHKVLPDLDPQRECLACKESENKLSHVPERRA